MSLIIKQKIGKQQPKGILILVVATHVHNTGSRNQHYWYNIKRHFKNMTLVLPSRSYLLKMTKYLER